MSIVCKYLVVTAVIQQVPDCDMALVHDDDLILMAACVCGPFIDRTASLIYPIF
jgi:hypothetical protein